MMEVMPVRTVLATVVGREDWKGKPTLKLDVPAFKSSYPLVIYNASDEHLNLATGYSAMFTLQADRLKNGAPEARASRLPWHYFWSIASIGEEVDADALDRAEYEQPMDKADVVFAAEAQRSSSPWPARDRSIWRQVALKAAVEVHQYLAIQPPAEGFDDVDAVLETAERFNKWIQEGL